MEHSSGLPNHVLKYLEESDVDVSALPDEVKATLAGLSLGEAALLKVVGQSLQGLDTEMIAKIH
jgi:hypothetical protein